MNWSERARSAAIALSTGEERQDDSTTVRLILDIVAVFKERGDRLKTADLLAGLYEIEESPWGDWFGKPLTAHGLSKLLQPYRIKTMPVRIDGEPARGYKSEQFSDAYARVVGVTGVTGVTSQARSHAGGNAGNACNASDAEQERDGGDDPEDHPGDTLEGALLAAFPAAALVCDDVPPWTTINEGRFGSLQIRDVPDDGRHVTGAGPT